MEGRSLIAQDDQGSSCVSQKVDKISFTDAELLSFSQFNCTIRRRQAMDANVQMNLFTTRHVCNRSVVGRCSKIFSTIYRIAKLFNKTETGGGLAGLILRLLTYFIRQIKEWVT